MKNRFYSSPKTHRGYELDVTELYYKLLNIYSVTRSLGLACSLIGLYCYSLYYDRTSVLRQWDVKNKSAYDYTSINVLLGAFISG